MIKKFTQNILILIFLNLLVKPFWIFAIDRSIQNKVGVENYGLYFSLFSFSLLFNMVSDLGLTNYNNRHIAQNRDLLSTQFGKIIPIKITLGLVYLLLTLAAGVLLDYSVYELKILSLLAFNQILVSFTLYLRSNISAIQLFNLDSFLSIIDKALMISICGYLLWFHNHNDFQIEWLIFSQTAAYLTSFIFVLLLVLYKTGLPPVQFKLTSFIYILKQSFPFALLAILMVSYTRTDAVMLERLLTNGKEEAGIYAQAYRISDALSMFAFLFASILLPLFAKMLKDGTSIQNTLSHSFTLLMVPSIALIVILFTVSTPIMEMLYHQQAEKSTEALNYLLIGFAGMCLTYIFGTLLTAAGKLKILNRLAFSALILNVILNLILIPRFGSKGAAISNMFTQIYMGISQAMISVKILDIKIHLKTTLNFSVYIVIMVISAVLWKKTGLPWYTVLAILPFLAFFSAIALKLLKLNFIPGIQHQSK